MHRLVVGQGGKQNYQEVYVIKDLYGVYCVLVFLCLEFPTHRLWKIDLRRKTRLWEKNKKTIIHRDKYAMPCTFKAKGKCISI